jgi:hypothetical protein
MVMWPNSYCAVFFVGGVLIQHNHTLQTLSLLQNQIGTAGANALAEALKVGEYSGESGAETLIKSVMMLKSASLCCVVDASMHGRSTITHFRS